ncbi:hypothetical protein OIV83_003367 [Microbotryomycetes sp. JL201]|nr:hypothetical protein OIV83_003367 [Microbotryomycetes sp. JL201]
MSDFTLSPIESQPCVSRSEPGHLPDYAQVVQDGLEEPPAYPSRPLPGKVVYKSTSDMIQVALFGSILFSRPRIFRRKSTASERRNEESLTLQAPEDIYLPSYEAALYPGVAQTTYEVDLWQNLPRSGNDRRNEAWGAAVIGRSMYPTL